MEDPRILIESAFAKNLEERCFPLDTVGELRYERSWLYTAVEFKKSTMLRGIRLHDISARRRRRLALEIAELRKEIDIPGYQRDLIRYYALRLYPSGPFSDEVLTGTLSGESPGGFPLAYAGEKREIAKSSGYDSPFLVVQAQARDIYEADRYRNAYRIVNMRADEKAKVVKFIPKKSGLRHIADALRVA